MRAIRVVLVRTPFWGASVSKDVGYVADLLADDRRSIAPFKAAGRALPRISIVVPNFNQGRFLEACLTSILDQEYPDFEVVMVDGGSTDESREIIERYADRLTWWVIEPDEGQADAINKGLRRCTGQVVNWVNADDRLTPGALRGVADAYLDHPAAAAWIGGCIRTDEEGAVADIIYPNGFDRDNIGMNWNGKQFYQPSCFLSAEVLRHVGLLDPALYIVLDLELWLRMLEVAPFVAGRGIWSTAINHADAKTQHSVDRIFTETADLQERLGFSEAARLRRACLEGAPIRYVAASGRPARSAMAFERRNHLCLVGDFTTPIDAEAARFLLDQIAPYLVRRPDTAVHLVGPGAASFRLRGRRSHLVTARPLPDDLPDALQHYRLCVRPQQGPITEDPVLWSSLEVGTPVVSTTHGLSGLALRDGVDCFIADTPMQFAEKCNQLLLDPIGWMNLSVRSQLLADQRSAGHA